MNFSQKIKYFALVSIFALLPLQFTYATTIGTDVAVSGNLTVAGNSTTTNATTTDLFSTTASSTNLFSSLAVFGKSTATNATTTGSGYFGGNVGIGETSPQAELHILGTGEQLRLGYDASDYASFLTSVAGALTIGSNGSGANIVVSPSLVVGQVPSSSYTPANTSWVAWVRAGDIAGSDGASLTSVPLSGGSASTFTGTATLRTGSNGIDGQSALQFNGTSDGLANTTGAGSLTGDFYAAAVVQFNSLTNYQNLLSWGNASNGEQRSLYKGTDNSVAFIGENADIDSGSPTVTTGTPYFFEMQREGTQISLWLNGVLVATGSPSLNSYSDADLYLGENLGTSFPLNGLLSEAFFLGSTIPSGTQSNLRNYISSRYGISMTDSATSPIDTGGTSMSFSNPATFSVNGSLAAYAVNAEHELTNDWSGQSSLLLWNKNPTGFSTMRFGYYSDGAEMGAIGYGVNNEPWAATTYGSDFIEISNFHDQTQWPIGRIVQTGPGGTATLRAQMAQNGDISIYNQKIMSDPLWAALVTIKNGGDVGIGTSTPQDILHVSSGPSATTTVEFGDQYSASSKTCFNVKNSAGAAISFFFNGTNMVVENSRCQ